MRQLGAQALALAFLVLAVNVAEAQRSAPGAAPSPQVIPGQFIVQLQPGASQDAVIRAHGLTPLARWQVINGFVARMSEVAANRLAADPLVKSVSPDLVVRAFAPPPGKGKPGGSTPPPCPDVSSAMSTPQQIPTGVQRIGAVGGTTGLGIKAAVIDTGIDDCHPDLKDNVKGGINLVDTSKSPRDDNGHGTHVGGIIGARDNGFGVVGVAPEASLYAVKVLDASGSGSLSTVVSGLDWAVKNGMRVVNLSLGAVDFWCVVLGLCGFGSECDAVNNATARGVTVVVAAGNDASDAVFYTPANCRDSITVTAFVDSDGLAGGLGPPFTINSQLEGDDTFAQSFSNFSQFGWDMDGSGAIDTIDDHPVVDFMAPGVQILSTTPTYTVTLTTERGLPLNYGFLTGTSMSTPHVAGAAVRYIATHPGATPEDVRRALVLGGECPSGDSPTWLICPSTWPDDPDPDLGSEPLVRVVP